MISENRKLEFWNFLVAEKNQPRPKGITAQRLAVIRPEIFSLDDAWVKIVDLPGIGDRSAADFYASNDQSAIDSRTEFWEIVRKTIRRDESGANQRSAASAGRTRARSGSTSRKGYK
jgi:hypothetical protein